MYTVLLKTVSLSSPERKPRATLLKIAIYPGALVVYSLPAVPPPLTFLNTNPREALFSMSVSVLPSAAEENF